MRVSPGSTGRMLRGADSFVPKVALFHCRWCLPESDAVKNLLPEHFESAVSTIKINCTARMEGELAIKAFGQGFDGVLVIGCEDGECHYESGNRQAFNRLGMLRRMLEFAGIYPERIGTIWVSPYDPASIKAQIGEYIEKLNGVGPF